MYKFLKNLEYNFSKDSPILISQSQLSKKLTFVNICQSQQSCSGLYKHIDFSNIKIYCIQ